MYIVIDSYAIPEVRLSCPKEVLELVDRFNCNREGCISTGYNEEQLRNEFINPFFLTLGWDVYNEQEERHSRRRRKRLSNNDKRPRSLLYSVKRD